MVQKSIHKQNEIVRQTIQEKNERADNLYMDIVKWFANLYMIRIKSNTLVPIYLLGLTWVIYHTFSRLNFENHQENSTLIFGNITTWPFSQLIDPKDRLLLNKIIFKYMKSINCARET